MSPASGRQGWGWSLGFAALFFWFFTPLLLLRSSFTGSDFEVQHWPWAHHLASAIREGRLPFWTPLVQNGLALAGEGQVGAFYPLHWIAYSLLPVKAAYTWLIPAHFLIAGWGMRRYLKRLGTSEPAAWLGAVVFCFGSAYAGCFSNTASLRVCAWIPWALLCLDRLRGPADRSRWISAASLAVLIALQWTAGAVQMALYSLVFYVAAAAVQAAADARKGRVFGPGLGSAGLAVIAGLALSFPQTWLTLEAAKHSVRAGETAAFALWGSIPPTGILSLIFPEWGGMMRLSFYMGIAPFLLCAAADWKRPAVKAHAAAAFVFFALALGRFNPLYASAIESFGMTWLRNPGKWLLFVSFSLSVLAASGLDRLLSGEAGVRSRLRIAAVVLFILTAALPGAVSSGMRAAGPMIEKAGRAVAARTVEEKGVRAKSEAYYAEKFNAIVRDVKDAASYGRPCVRYAILWSFLALLCVGAAGAARGPSPRLAAACLSLITVLDLGVYGMRWSTGFVGNAGPFPPDEIGREWKRGEPAEGGWVEIFDDPRDEKFTPNRGMLYGIPHPGGYTPLMNKSYYELVWDLGIADASLGRAPVREEMWRQRRGLVDLIGSRWVRSRRELDWPSLTLLRRGAAEYDYRNEASQPAVSGYTGWAVMPDPVGRLEFIKSSAFDPAVTVIAESGPIPAAASAGRVAGKVDRWGPDRLDARIEMPADGIVMLRVVYDRAWRVKVNAAPAETIVLDHAFLGVRVPAGPVRIEARYEPYRQLLERTGILHEAS